MYSNNKKSRSGLVFGAQMWPEVVIMEGTQGGFGDQSRALHFRFVAVVWERGLQELLWSHTLLPTFLHPSLCSQLWDSSKPKVSKHPGFI